MKKNNEDKYKERFLSSPSVPEVIRVDKIKKHEHSLGDARLRFGFVSYEKEISFDVNKVLTKEMLIDLHGMIGNIIKKIDTEEEEELTNERDIADEI